MKYQPQWLVGALPTLQPHRIRNPIGMAAEAAGADRRRYRLEIAV